MSGKYSEVVKTLSREPVKDTAYQTRVDEKKAEILRTLQEVTPESLGKAYAMSRALKDDIEGELSLLNLELAALEQLITTSHEAGDPGWGAYGASPDTVRLPTGASISVGVEPLTAVEDKEAFRVWCIDNGYEHQLQLWPSTANAMVKDRLLEGLSTPDGVRVYMRNKILFRRG
jgi:hypothetical protein